MHMCIFVNINTLYRYLQNERSPNVETNHLDRVFWSRSRWFPRIHCTFTDKSLCHKCYALSHIKMLPLPGFAFSSGDFYF